MRDRLIELLAEVDNKVLSDEEIIELTPEKSYGIIADHLIENGVILPPCKVGQRVYIIDEAEDSEEAGAYVLDVKISSIGYDLSGFWIIMRLPLGFERSAYADESSFGKTVFLTLEEAEKALKERTK